MNLMKIIITLKIFLFALTRVDAIEIISKNFKYSQIRSEDCYGCIDEPLCATDGKCFKVFPNKIVYDAQNYVATELYQNIWHKVDRKNCECPRRCVNIFQPVCAYRDGAFQIFPSECALNEVNCDQNQGWQEVPYFLCQDKKGQDNCPIVCSKLYAPVCVYDGYSFETLTNMCFLDLLNCLNDEDVGLFSIGECPRCLYDYVNELY